MSNSLAETNSSAPGPGPSAPAGPELSSRERFLAAAACRPLARPPLWLMRQAGRALPEYRKLKEQYTFLQLVQTPELAAEVTLQPIRRFGFDAAVFFSDILVVSEAMGQAYRFREQGGIEMDFTVATEADIERLQTDGVGERLQYVARAQRMVRTELGDRTALLGFAGSPWTLANFMMEGGSAKEPTQAKRLFHTQPAAFRKLMEKLTRAVTEFLHLQIDAGVDAVQIFDSLGGLLSPRDYAGASADWMREIVRGVKGRVPVIVFARATHGSWESLLGTGAQCFSVDWTVSLAQVAARLPAGVAVQGNLDPCLLTTTPEIVAAEARAILESMRGRPGHIFNLGHGVTPAARLECMEALAHTVRSFQ